jgi:hypothetical protein
MLSQANVQHNQADGETGVLRSPYGFSTKHVAWQRFLETLSNDEFCARGTADDSEPPG